MPIRIRELEHAEIPSIFPLIQQLNPWMTKAEFTRRLNAMLPNSYRVAGAFDGTALVGCSGFWISTRFWCGKQFDIDNFVVDPTHQGGGIGKKLVAWLEKKALAEQCDLIVLDSYVSTPGAHMFYYKQGFVITGYHFTKIPGSHEAGKLPHSREI